MSWKLDRLESTLGGVISGTGMASDPTSDSSSGKSSANAGAGGVVQIGTVVRSGVGSYDCSVRIGGNEIGCQISSGIVSPTFGYSLGFVPPEGSTVLVVMPSKNSRKGVVVGMVPMGWMVTPNKVTPTNVPQLYSAAQAGYGHYPAFQTPVLDKKYPFKVSSPNNRPADVLHGEVYLQNEHSCGFFGGALSANLQGGGAFVKVSRIEDLVRIRSANYERWSDGTVSGEYNDLAYITDETQSFSYQGERMGDKGLVPEGAIIADGSTPVVPHPRIKRFVGALGTVCTTIVERPEQNRVSKALRDKDPKDEGVLSSHVGEDGEVMVRSAGGMFLERYDRIPSVRRVRKPYDPEGDRDVKAEPIKPFEHGEDDALLPLELFDSLAWDQKGMYQRFDEHEKDFRTQEEKDLKAPGDSNRDPSGSTSSMSRNDGRRCGVYLAQNGGIVIRDAWGSEISMVGGNIYINTPGSIVATANRSIVSFAHDTNAVKARKIAAVESLEVAEIRGARYANIQGGCDEKGGGVLVESFGTEDYTVSKKGEGHSESVSIHGIILKSASGLNLRAKDLRTTVDESVVVGCGAKGDRSSGMVRVSSGFVEVAAGEKVSALTKRATVQLSDGTVNLISDGGTNITSKGDVRLVRNAREGMGTLPVDLPPETSKAIVEQVRNLSDQYEAMDPEKTLRPYAIKDYEEYVYSQLGTSEQYGTGGGSDLQGGVFTMYAPYWHAMRNDGGGLVSSVSPKAWDETSCKVYGNCAWPGIKAMESGKFASLEKPYNLKGGLSVSRKDARPKSDVKLKGMKEFMV